MSYTKFSKEVTKWLKDNGLPCYGTANDSPEETKARLDAWMHGSKEILRQWITEKRYRELISCAHGGWYQDDVIFEPLAEHFVANHLFDELRFLCERGIRFSAEDMLATIKSEKEEHGTLDIETIRSIDVPSYVSGRSYSHLGEIAKYRKRALDQIIRYAGHGRTTFPTVAPRSLHESLSPDWKSHGVQSLMAHCKHKRICLHYSVVKELLGSCQPVSICFVK